MSPKFEQAAQNSPSPTIIILREYLTSRFSLIELEIIVHNLSINFETLRYQTNEELVLNLIGYCQQHNRLVELMAVAQEIRPETRKVSSLRQLADLKLDLEVPPKDILSLMLSYSYEELDEAAQTRFRALGTLAHAQPFDLPMLAALWQVSEELAEEYANEFCMLALMEATRPESDGTGKTTAQVVTDALWYRLHPLLQNYACSLLQQFPAEQAAVQLRYQEQIIGRVKQFDKLLPKDWGQLTPYLPHLQAVGTSLVVEMQAQSAIHPDLALCRLALRFALNTCVYLSQRRKVREADWLQMGLQASRYLYDQKREGLFLAELGGFYSALGEKAKALQYYEEALPLYQFLSDRPGEATVRNNIGLAYSTIGETTKALQYYEQAQTLRRAIGDRGGEAITFVNMGGCYSATGEKVKALECYKEALPLLREMGNQDAEATALNNIGIVYKALGENAKALEYFNQALLMRRATGNRGWEATALNNIGAIYSATGEKVKALEHYEQALALRKAVGDRSGEANSFIKIALCYSAIGKKVKAVKYYNQALSLMRAIGNRQGEANTLNSMGSFYYDFEENVKALKYFNQALLLRKALGDRFGEAATYHAMGWACYALAQLDEAVEWMARCVEIEEEIKHPNLESDRVDLARFQAALEQSKLT